MNSLYTSVVRFLTLAFLLAMISFNQPLVAQRGNEREGSSLPWGTTFGAYLSTSGAGGQINYLWGRTSTQFMVSVDGYVIKDARETPIESAFGEQGGEYTYGKLNYVFMIAPGVGIQQDLFPASDRNLVDFRWSAQIGPSFAMIIPYKLAIFTPLAGRPQYGRPTFEPFNPEQHGYEDIIRRAKLFDSEESTSLDASTDIGINVRSNILIDFSRADEYVGGIQLGVAADWFSDSLPIMAFVENRQLYISATVGVVFGLRN